ncbi:MAG: glycosyltransferase family 2 protein [Candidatus Nomurabacteria bacterium]|jgi:glycosyltransferase involved in cell wall biosynthesis|nr:glycosyltransferase family 2 protein [Candidatus Nomurabacteria bacterium]
MKTPRVAIIIPCYNESQTIGEVVAQTKKTFAGQPCQTEIIVINDQSSDNSEKTAQKSGAVVINHILNQGAGAATSTGLSYAKQNHFDWAITMDADGQHDPNDALKCLNYAIKNQIDLLIGSRLINTQGMSKVKILGNKGLSFITWALFGVNVTDSQSGLRVFSKRALNTLEWQSTGYEFCSEMLWRAKQSKLKIAEHPIKAIYTEYSKTKGQNNWNGVNIVKSLVRRRITEMFE